MQDVNVLIEQTLFALEDLLELINEGTSHTVAMEALVRVTAFHFESYIIESGGMAVIKDNPCDWLRSV